MEHKTDRKKVLFFEWNAFMQRDIESILKNMPEIDLTLISYEFKNVDDDSLFMERFPIELLKAKYDMVFSVNFFPLVSDICEKYNIPYISWVYDSPMNVRKTDSYNNHVNKIYIFDQALCDSLKSKGFDTIYHMPLGVDTQKSDLFSINMDDSQNMTRLRSEISFVGRLYSSDYDYMTGPLPAFHKNKLEEVLSAQLFNYDRYIFTDFLTDEYMEEINEIFKKATGNISYKVLASEWEFLLASEVTRRERIAALTTLSQKHPVALFSYDKIPAAPNVDCRGTVNYYTEMPKVFHNSKINLNITLKIIKSGIPLRIMDIFGAEGFLLSNYQRELAEYYTDGHDMVMYKSLSELCEKADYYLKNENERKNIAINGHAKTAKLFELETCIKRILLWN